MKTSTMIAWIMLILVALLHLYRAIAGITMVIGDYILPMSISWIAFVVIAIVTIGMWRESRS